MLKSGFFCNRKGDISNPAYFTLIQIILAAMVIGALLLYVISAVNNSLYEQIYVSKDNALLINALYAAPGDVSDIYTEDKLKDFIIDYKGQTVSVTENTGNKKGILGLVQKVKTKPLPSTAPYAQNANPMYVEMIKGTEQIYFSKEKESLKVKNG